MYEELTIEEALSLALVLKAKLDELMVHFDNAPQRWSYMTKLYEKHFDELIPTPDFSPKIFEFLIFGSVAKGEKECVGDLDLMIFDNGYFSSFFSKASGSDGDLYTALKQFAAMLYLDWLGMDIVEFYALKQFASVDMHMLPVNFLTSPEVRSDVAFGHGDPAFFQNCFGSILRFDEKINNFVPVDLGYFEKKYQTTLEDLQPDRRRLVVDSYYGSDDGPQAYMNRLSIDALIIPHVDFDLEECGYINYAQEENDFCRVITSARAAHAICTQLLWQPTIDDPNFPTFHFKGSECQIERILSKVIILV